MGGNRQSSEHIIANCQWETFLVLLPSTQSLRWVPRHWTGNWCLSPKPVLADTPRFTLSIFAPLTLWCWISGSIITPVYPVKEAQSQGQSQHIIPTAHQENNTQKGQPSDSKIPLMLELDGPTLLGKRKIEDETGESSHFPTKRIALKQGDPWVSPWPALTRCVLILA